MHVVLICTSVIMQLHSVFSSDRITNITSECLANGKGGKYILTSGMGSYDGKVFLIESENLIKCEINILVMNNNFVVAVIEIPDWKISKKLCIQERPSAVMVSKFKENETCTSILSEPRYSVLNQGELSILIQELGTIKSIKIIATSLRDPGLYPCNPHHEIDCVFQHKLFCLQAYFTCNGDANCGVPDQYDEDIRICKGMGVSPFMIFCSVAMYVMSLFLLALLILSFSPIRKETFVFKFDHRIPLFDTETGVLNYDIDIKVIFPSKSLHKTKSILIKK